MKNELSRRGNYSDYDFFEDAMREGEAKVTSICAPILKRATRAMKWR